jgi:hypothetical protein
MYDYINAAFVRMDLQNVREFLLGDKICESPNNASYRERLEEPHAILYKRITDVYAHDSHERTKAETELADALNAQMEVYMEMGMKAGARLIYQLLLSDSPAPIKTHESSHGSEGKP